MTEGTEGRRTCSNNVAVTVVPHSDLTLEWLHSIQPGREGRAQGDTHTHTDAPVCANSEKHKKNKT